MSNFGNDVTLAPAGTVITASGTGSVVLEPINRGTLRALLDVTAASGTTPSLTLTVETSYDKGATDSWHSAGAFGAVTAVGKSRKIFQVDRYVRISWVVSGTTPSFTLGVFGEIV